MRSDVLIIGGGVIGLAIAREVRLRGAGRITLLEKGVCGEESSWAAAGMLGPQAEAENLDTFFDLCCESRAKYPEFAESLLSETGIDIELDRSGTLFLAFTEEDEQSLEHRFEWQKKAGLVVERLSAEQTRQAEPFVSPDVRMSLLFPNDWQVDNRKLLASLKHFADANDITIHENTAVEALTTANNRVTGATTKTSAFLADQTVLATGAWSSLIKIGNDAPPFAIVPVRGQIICLRTAKRLFEHVVYSRRGYLVPRSDGRILAGATSEMVGFTKGVTGEAADQLRNMAFEIAPSLDNLPVADHWSGLRPSVSDSLPVIGAIKGTDGLFVATAHYRNGILLAPLTAALTADMLMGSPIEKRIAEFSPNRFRSAASRFGRP